MEQCLLLQALLMLLCSALFVSLYELLTLRYWLNINCLCDYNLLAPWCQCGTGWLVEVALGTVWLPGIGGNKCSKFSNYMMPNTYTYKCIKRILYNLNLELLGFMSFNNINNINENTAVVGHCQRGNVISEEKNCWLHSLDKFGTY